jgi:GT2 family glycosyltransferase
VGDEGRRRRPDRRRYVEEILRAADDDPSRNIIFSPAQHFGSRTDVYTYPPFDPPTMTDTLMIAGCAAMKRELWDAVGGYDETMRFAEDWDLHVRAQLAVGLVPHQLGAPLWFYRKHGPSASTAGIKRLPDLRRYWEGHTRESVTARSRSWGEWCSYAVAS